MSGSSSTHSIRSGSVTKYGERIAAVELHPLDDLDRRLGALGLLDRDRRPSPPTLLDARRRRARRSSRRCAPRSSRSAPSPCGSRPGATAPCSVATATRSPRSSPRLRSIALAPAATLRTPSAKIACASSVDVVVPSPTASPVRSAAWRIIWTPRFSSGSSRSISLAIVTPSLQTIGVPHFFPMRTHFDFGPSVTRTASASAVAPRRIFSRASARKSSCLWAMMSS